VPDAFVIDPRADARATAAWNPQKMGKATLFNGAHLLAGLNAFEPGQEHAAHVHAATDKLYQVVEGTGQFTVGAESRTLSTGALIFAPADVPHSVRNLGPSRLLILVVIAPPPRK